MEKSSETLPRGGSSRFDEIDVAKGIGILLVIFFHIHTVGASCTVVYSFHMPLFFLISGFLFRKEKYPSFGGFLKQRFKTLVTPYLLFAFASLLLNIFILDVYQGNGLSAVLSMENLKKFAEIFIVRQSSKIDFNTPMWFVPCLFLVEIIYFFLSKIKNKPALCVTVFLLAAAGWYLASEHCFFDSSFLPWNLPAALFSLSFYCTGNIAAPYIRKFLKDSKTYVFALVFIICAAVDIPLALLNGEISLGSREFRNGFILYIAGIVGTVGILALSKLICRIGFLRLYGKNSFYIMAMHYPIFSISRSVIQKVEEKTGTVIYDKSDVLRCFVIFIAVLAVSTVLTFIYVSLKTKILARKKA